MNTATATAPEVKSSTKFTKYEIFVVSILAILQFTIILDFMVLSPLGAILLPELDISPSQFSLVVSAYAFSAGASGLLAAGFADKFDRKKLLLFFYAGFILGTILCAMAANYQFLFFARVVTGIFGGVISSIGFAIIIDLFRMEFRGRVMGMVQMAFAASQILGIPIGLYLANKINWHAPFWMIAGFSCIVFVVIFMYMKPVAEHLKIKSERNAFTHLWKTLSEPGYLMGFVATTLLMTGGFMLMPFGSAFSTNNLKIAMEDLPLMYGVTGVFSILFGPMLGKLSDKIGKFPVFFMGSILAMLVVFVYTNLGPTPLFIAMAINVLLFLGISARMISSSALITGLPRPADRGAFMSINSSIQQIAGGISASIAGMIVVQSADGTLLHYSTLGYVVNFAILITVALIYLLDKQIKKNSQKN